MPYRTDVIYRYDGSFDGLLCCVFEAISRGELPAAIQRGEEAQLSLLEAREIASDPQKARRVERSIPTKISREAADLVWKAHLTCLPEREKHILAFLRLGYRIGPSVMNHLSDDAVNDLNRAVLHLEREAHLFLGFVRFTESEGALAAAIEPKNCVLPLIAPHFCDRFSGETFLIFDRTHGQALVHQGGRGEILPLEALELPPPDEKERFARDLWRAYHRAVSIGPRENPRCQMNHLPLRFRGAMTEFTADAPAELCYTERAGARPPLSHPA